MSEEQKKEYEDSKENNELYDEIEDILLTISYNYGIDEASVEVMNSLKERGLIK
jgi:hypothetical protein